MKKTNFSEYNYLKFTKQIEFEGIEIHMIQKFNEYISR